MSDCCSSSPKKPQPKTSCCSTKKVEAVEPSGASNAVSSCCDSSDADAGRSFDTLLWGSMSLVVAGYLLHLLDIDGLPHWLHTMSHGIFELMNTMWWGVVLGALFVGLLQRIPQTMVISILGRGGSVSGLLRATGAGVLLDLCSHGILMVGMQLYHRGASLGQVMAFLIASPWNSFSLTIIMFSLIGLWWTLSFILLSVIIALISGWIFDRLVARNVLPQNPNQIDLPDDYHFGTELSRQWGSINWSSGLLVEVIWDGIKGSRMVLRWLLLGVIIATALRAFMSLDDFQNWFGPTLLGLLATLVAATIIEVCSEGSTPIAADLLTRAGAPGNSFAFMMTGVATDYTEVMVLKDTTRSWKIALFLPLVTVPQVIVIAVLMNLYG